MRALWSLPKAAPALLRHLAAYFELIALDVGRAKSEIGKTLLLGAGAAVCAIFALFFGCIAIIAYFWDTDYRVASILAIFAFFLVIAVALLVYRSRISRASSVFLGDVRKQWAEDRILLERILSPDEEQRP